MQKELFLSSYTFLTKSKTSWHLWNHGYKLASPSIKTKSKESKALRESILRYLELTSYTAYAHKDDYQKCLDIGMDVVLNKPSKPKIILDTIIKCMKVSSFK